MDLTWSEFERVEMRVGTIQEVNDFPEARNLLFNSQLILVSALGIRKTSAQITKKICQRSLLGGKSSAVVNFPKKQIGKFMSECLVLGAVGEEGM